MDKARLALAAALLMTSSCEHGAPVTIPPAPQPLSAPNSLSPAARAQLRGTIDLNALDRLLNSVSSEERARLLATFEDAEWFASGRRDVETRGVSIIVHFPDAERQRLLEQVWVPFWSHLPSAALSDPAYPLPGRNLAIMRRADSASAAQRGRDP